MSALVATAGPTSPFPPGNVKGLMHRAAQSRHSRVDGPGRLIWDVSRGCERSWARTVRHSRPPPAWVELFMATGCGLPCAAQPRPGRSLTPMLERYADLGFLSQVGAVAGPLSAAAGCLQMQLP